MLTSISQTITMDFEEDPTKLKYTNEFLPRVAHIVAGYRRDDPPTDKKLPVEVDVCEWLIQLAQTIGATALMMTVGDWSLIAFYYLLRIGEYTIKRSRNESKQTKQFKMEDVTFFSGTELGHIRKIPFDAEDAIILTADSASLKLDNMKNGHKGVCVHHHANGHKVMCPVKALARRYCHIRQHSRTRTELLSAYWEGGQRHDLTDVDMRKNLKLAATALKYPEERGIPVEKVDTHSLRIGGANALSLAGYSDRQIMKMGRWKSQTFLEYVRDELHCFAAGMSKSMKKMFGFVNVSGGAYHDVSNAVVATSLGPGAAASA